ncbi:MAG: ATP synthase F1 subunit delta [Coriobacteriales bacterium]|jgi:F-type H+-transporting ATPase subunit delta|nr:ATP synthase F1 subunit delta [Coriobacteriales bacterium]
MRTNSIQLRAKALVYAEVLLEACKVSDNVFAVAGEFDDLVKAVRGSLELRKALKDKTIPLEAKKALVTELFTGYAPELLATFNVMVEREDLGVLSRARETFNTLAEEALNAIFIEVTTAVSLDDELRQQIISKYSAQLGCGVLLREYVDPDLIGGIVLMAHGKRIDASVTSQLESARHVLSKASVM